MGQNKSKQRAVDAERSSARWLLWRPWISLLLLLHLTVVAITPLAIVPPYSELAMTVAQWAAPYLEAGNISHGYAFFAPDPGPSSSIVRYEIESADGSVKEGQLPDADVHWPRLFYHRHFMLSEQLGGMAEPPRGPPPPPETLDPLLRKQWEEDNRQWEEAFEQWKVARDRYVDRARSYARHLLKKHDAAEVRLRLIRHRIPSPEQVRNGVRLDDKSSYVEDEQEPIAVVKAGDAS